MTNDGTTIPDLIWAALLVVLIVGLSAWGIGTI